jgi:hypothetical protein
MLYSEPLEGSEKAVKREGISRFLGTSFVRYFLLSAVIAGLCVSSEAASPAVTVAYVQGKATVTPAGCAGTVALAEDRTVVPGDRIETGSDGSVELVLADESVVKIGPESSVVVKEAGYVEVTKKSSNILDLVYGKVRAVVAPLLNEESVFIIETENTTVGVRGTDFVVSHDKAARETDVLCSDGSVELRPRDVVRKGLAPILVRGDEGIRLVAGKLPEKPARWVDERRKKLVGGLDFQGRRTKKILEQRIKYLRNKGETAVDNLKDGGSVIRNKTERVIRKIFPR